MRPAALVILALLLTGCMTVPVYRLTSFDPGARWSHGRQWVVHDSGGVSVEVSYDRCWSQYVLFHVVVTNFTDTMLRVDPAQFTYEVAGEREHAKRRSRRYPAVDLEEAIHRLDQLAASQQGAHATFGFLGLLSGAADLVNDIAESGKRTEEEQRQDDAEDAEREALRQDEQSEFESRMYSLEQERDRWATSALRKTDLAPGESVGGKLLLAAAPVQREVDTIDYARRTGGRKEWEKKPPAARLSLFTPAHLGGERLEFSVIGW